MSCILGYIDANGNVWMAADGRVSAGGYICPGNTLKLFKMDNVTFGVVGMNKTINVLKHELKVLPKTDNESLFIYELTKKIKECKESCGGVLEKNEDGYESFDSSLLIHYNGKLYITDSVLDAYEVDAKFCGIGCCDEAIGFLEAAQYSSSDINSQLLGALSVSAKYNSSVGEPFEVRKVWDGENSKGETK
jgi:ATP-dependent protease HslVU (ClpYQ) peptidase subunit